MLLLMEEGLTARKERKSKHPSASQVTFLLLFERGSGKVCQWRARSCREKKNKWNENETQFSLFRSLSFSHFISSLIGIPDQALKVQVRLYFFFSLFLFFSFYLEATCDCTLATWTMAPSPKMDKSTNSQLEKGRRKAKSETHTNISTCGTNTNLQTPLWGPKARDHLRLVTLT